mgnify:CR=1 FL=1
MADGGAPGARTQLLASSQLAHTLGPDALDSVADELRFFAGLSVEETAETLGAPPHKIKREWRKARAFLFEAIQEAG